MLHPSYTDLMQLVNSEVESGEAPVVNSRYSIVLATSKRARQLIDGVPAMSHPSCPKPLSVAIDELNSSKIHILSEEEAAAANARREAKKKEAEEKKAEEKPAADTAGEKTTITVLRPGDQDKVASFLEPAIEAFEKENPDIHV